MSRGGPFRRKKSRGAPASAADPRGCTCVKRYHHFHAYTLISLIARQERKQLYPPGCVRVRVVDAPLNGPTRSQKVDWLQSGVFTWAGAFHRNLRRTLSCTPSRGWGAHGRHTHTSLIGLIPTHLPLSSVSHPHPNPNPARQAHTHLSSVGGCGLTWACECDGGARRPSPCRAAAPVQGYLAHKKHPPRRNLQ